MQKKPLTTIIASGLLAASLPTVAFAEAPKMKMTTDIPASVNQAGR